MAYITSTEQGTYSVRQHGTHKLLHTTSSYKAAKAWARSRRLRLMGVCMLEWENE